MAPLHELVTRIGLTATSKYGFTLAGGYAVQAHGFLNRVSEDVDLFTVNEERAQPRSMPTDTRAPTLRRSCPGTVSSAY
jgi:hypothetical protein